MGPTLVEKQRPKEGGIEGQGMGVRGGKGGRLKRTSYIKELIEKNDQLKGGSKEQKRGPLGTN